MALRSPNANTPSSQSRKSVFSSSNSLIPSSARRPSTSSVTGPSTPSLSQGIGFSPSPQSTPTPAGSGIPSFRTLRSLLPFGPNKNATPVSASVSPSMSVSRSPFAGFGSVRRSITKDRERKTSLSNDALMPIIAIDRFREGPLADDTAIRRSASLSRLEKPLPDQPFVGSPNPFRKDLSLASAFILRTPSPGPPLSAELSTIIEADSSGVSKHVLFLHNNVTPIDSRSSSPTILNRDHLQAKPTHPSHASTSSGNVSPNHYSHSNTHSNSASASVSASPSGCDADTSALDLSTTYLKDQVLHAIREADSSSNSAKQWLIADKAVIIDGDAHPGVGDNTFNMDLDLSTVDPELAALLSPHAAPKTAPRRSTEPSPTTPTFPVSPASRLPRARQASSFLPRLRPSMSPSASPTTAQFPITTASPTSPLSTPKASPGKGRTPAIAVNGSDYHTPGSPPRLSAASAAAVATPASRRTAALARPSPRLFSPSNNSSASSLTTTSRAGKVLNRPSAESKTPSSGTSTNNTGTRTLRQVMLGVRSDGTPNTTTTSTASPPSPSRMPRASLDSRRAFTAAAGSNDIGLGRPSLEMRRGGSFDSRTRPQSSSGLRTARSSTSPERTSTEPTEMESSPSPDTQYEEGVYYRPSMESNSTATRMSVDSSRPGSAARFNRERQRTPSLRVTDTSGAAGERERALAVPRQHRTRKRSMSVQERYGKSGGGGRYPGAAGIGMGSESAVSRPASSLSVHGRMGRSGSLYADAGEGGVGGPKMEWLGPRTAKAFRAAGLLDYEREKERSERERERERERDGSDTTERLRERSGSVGGVMSPSPLGSSGNGNGNGASSLNRFASIRSASEYNPSHARAQSRMAFSEIGGGASGRRGSGTFSAYGGSQSQSQHGHGHAGLMESPTFTVSSGSRDRDTPKSTTSTAPTSLSESFGYLGRTPGDNRSEFNRERERERERDREEMREMRERHGTEMGALLSALSDSQRTARVLRDENAELRERIEGLGGVLEENEELRRECASLRDECGMLGRECAELRREVAVGGAGRAFRTGGLGLGVNTGWGSAGSGGSSGFKTPVGKAGGSSPLAQAFTPRAAREDEEEEVYDQTFIDHGSEVSEGDDSELLPPSNGNGHRNHMSLEDSATDLLLDLPASSSTPSIKRRLSTTSSIFPMVPPNMTLLLSEDPTISPKPQPFRFPPSHPSSPSPSKPPPSLSPMHPRGSPPISYKAFASNGHAASSSVTSVGSVSPTAASFSFSVGPGSPGSLFLRPEHELLLGDMESLDLGVLGGEGEGEGTDEGGNGNGRAIADGW
ncbi:hypothetical protein B0H34DRAFT_860805 [Crassisporium funariophilum]|nr:hypothetical protein B0H34DRAFT_860805 [Crassisporium funariophilum]